DLLFFQPGRGGPYKLWHYGDGYQELQASFNVGSPISYTLKQFEKFVRDVCPDWVLPAVIYSQIEEQRHLQDLVDNAPAPRDREWLDTFRSVSTDLPEGAGKLDARLEISYHPSDHRDRDRILGNRTLVEGLVRVPLAEAAAAELAGHRAFNFI